MSFYVYILQSEKDHSLYFGQTSDLEARLKRHNAGLENYTRKKTPWKVLWHTAVNTRSEAVRFERKLKNMKSTKRVLEFIEKSKVPPQ